MKWRSALFLCVSLAFAHGAQADNIIRTLVPITKSPGTWVGIPDQVSDWVSIGDIGGCSNWSPAASTVTIGEPFTQTATDCLQIQQKTSQARQQNDKTGIIRFLGDPVITEQSISKTSTRSAVGSDAVPADVYLVAFGVDGGDYLTGRLTSLNSPSNTTITSIVVSVSNGYIQYRPSPTYLPSSLKTFKWEMLDGQGVVQYSTQKISAFAASANVIGVSITKTDITAAKKYATWRFTVKRSLP